MAGSDEMIEYLDKAFVGLRYKVITTLAAVTPTGKSGWLVGKVFLAVTRQINGNEQVALFAKFISTLPEIGTA